MKTADWDAWGVGIALHLSGCHLVLIGLSLNTWSGAHAFHGFICNSVPFTCYFGKHAIIFIRHIILGDCFCIISVMHTGILAWVCSVFTLPSVHVLPVRCFDMSSGKSDFGFGEISGPEEVYVSATDI